MARKRLSKPSPVAQAYIDAYVRSSDASCHDVGRLFGVTHAAIAPVLRRWAVPQRYVPNDSRGNRAPRFAKLSHDKWKKPRAQKKVPPPLAFDEVKRRLLERSCGQAA